MQMYATTTAQPTLNLGDVARLPISLPPKAEREAIVSVLRTLDDKIELNRQMNETLDALAHNLFCPKIGMIPALLLPLARTG
jgi:type I restriction enzyme, S subunit